MVYVALFRVLFIYAGAVLLSHVYTIFMAEMGVSFARMGNAFWGMILLGFLLGLVAAFPFPFIFRPSWFAVLLPIVLLGLGVFRSSPEGVMLFGITPWANTWVPPVLSVVAGATAAQGLGRR